MHSHSFSTGGKASPAPTEKEACRLKACMDKKTNTHIRSYPDYRPSATRHRLHGLSPLLQQQTGRFSFQHTGHMDNAASRYGRRRLQPGSKLERSCRFSCGRFKFHQGTFSPYHYSRYNFHYLYPEHYKQRLPLFCFLCPLSPAIHLFSRANRESLAGFPLQGG